MVDVYRSDDQSLQDRVVIVTGGGRGLGREMALALVASGARVVITGARSQDELDNVKSEAAEIAGADRLCSLLADVTDPDACSKVINCAMDTYGDIYGLINNAGRGMRLISETYNAVRGKKYDRRRSVEPRRSSITPVKY